MSNTSKENNKQGNSDDATENMTGPSPSHEDNYVTVMNSSPYYATREALAKNTFKATEDSAWPTALFAGASGHAQLRPLALDNHAMLSAEELDHWTALVWRQREELSDLDADVLDALSAMWLVQVRSPNEDAIAEIDELLKLRGLQPKTSARGAGGYRRHQRDTILSALRHIQNLWVNISEVDVFDKRASKTSRETIQSRAFVITDRMGQLQIDGSVDVKRFIFRPGKVFARYLFGPGRQTALLTLKALQYDPKRQKREKRLARYLSWQWRIRASKDSYLHPYRIKTLLEAIGEPLDTSRPTRTKDRLERALDTLLDDQVIAGWQYDRWDEQQTEKRGWGQTWLIATVLVEPPEHIRDYYDAITSKETQKITEAQDEASFGQRIRQRRKKLGQTQLQAAEKLNISQSYLSLLERGKVKQRAISVGTLRTIEQWLGQ